jgi:hypothetical protein
VNSAVCVSTCSSERSDGFCGLTSAAPRSIFLKVLCVRPTLALTAILLSGAVMFAKYQSWVGLTSALAVLGAVAVPVVRNAAGDGAASHPQQQLVASSQQPHPMTSMLGGAVVQRVDFLLESEQPQPASDVSPKSPAPRDRHPASSASVAKHSNGASHPKGSLAPVSEASASDPQHNKTDSQAAAPRLPLTPTVARGNVGTQAAAPAPASAPQPTPTVVAAAPAPVPSVTSSTPAPAAAAAPAPAPAPAAGAIDPYQHHQAAVVDH